MVMCSELTRTFQKMCVEEILTHHLCTRLTQNSTEEAVKTWHCWPTFLRCHNFSHKFEKHRQKTTSVSSIKPQSNKANHKPTNSNQERIKNMSLFLPPNVKPLEPAASMENWNDQSLSAIANADFFKCPKGMENRSVQLDYTQL